MFSQGIVFRSRAVDGHSVTYPVFSFPSVPGELKNRDRVRVGNHPIGTRNSATLTVTKSQILAICLDRLLPSANHASGLSRIPQDVLLRSGDRPPTLECRPYLF